MINSLMMLMLIAVLGIFAYLIVTKVGFYGLLQISCSLLVFSLTFRDKEGWSISVFVVGVLSLLVLVTAEFGPLSSKKLFACWTTFAIFMAIGGVGDFNNQLGMVLAWMITIPLTFLMLSPPRRPPSFISPVILLPAVFTLSNLLLVSPFASQIPVLKGLETFTNEWGFERFLGTLQDYELTAELLAIIVVVSIVSAAKSAKPQIRFFFWLQALVAMYLGILTASRSFPLLSLPAVAVCFWTYRKEISSYAKFTFIASTGVLLFVKGATLLARLGEITGAVSVSEKINREQVWSLYASRVNDASPIIGHGPLFPWTQYGLYPHSLPNAILYAGGWVSLFLFVASIGFILIMIFREFDKGIKVVKFLALSIFLVDEYKVEFIRQPNYVNIIAIFFACLGSSYVGTKGELMSSNNTDSNDTSLPKLLFPTHRHLKLNSAINE